MEVTIQHPFLRRPFGSLFTSRLFDQFFGEGLFDSEPFFGQNVSQNPFLLLQGRSSPLQRLTSILDSGLSELRVDRERFSIHLDVRHFSPTELSVKIVDDSIEVHAKHEERADEHGLVSREFLRRYRLPVGVQADSVTAALTTDGVLTLSAPRRDGREPRDGRESRDTRERPVHIACDDKSSPVGPPPPERK
ncbi:alpha-crystallin A chain-like [Lethenteron reissneri]|uniref:alpha-crystallin A chain-like n=1 Tax=Lethenteron reissneri TaxID=7753 RepID=UPI002AB7342A|nr:alpha-crystallin A chain-like [Lethenteron reissneri]